MSIQVALKHRTHYQYDKLVSLGPQTVQLRPAPHCRTPILSYSLQVTPTDRILNWHLDAHSNHLARMLFPNKTNEFAVEVDLVAELSPVNPFDFFLEPGFENLPFAYSSDLVKDLVPYLEVGPAGPRLLRFLGGLSTGKSPSDKQGTVSFLVDLNHKVRDEVGYVTRFDPGVQSSEQTLECRTGSCRDSAWLLVEILRHLGIAARFVSGYLIQLASEETVSGDGTNGGVKTDSADLHAWAEAFLPGAGWIGMDPTSGLFAGEGHIPLVCTPNAAKAAPIGGTVEPAKVELDFSMSVRRINAPSSLARPFTDEEWEQVRAVAHAVDAELEAQDVRLTMGGEPTFVGIDEPESRQWNLDALGDLKRSSWTGPDSGLAREERGRRNAALRAREVVSRRAAPALGAELLLACRRGRNLGEHRLDRPRRRRSRFWRERCFRVCTGAYAATRSEQRESFARVQCR